MAPTSFSRLTLLLLSFSAIASLAGLLQILIALFPKRKGDTPYCRKCRYNLTGTDRAAPAARCPECGAALQKPAAIRIGERRVRRTLLLAGLMCLLVGAPLPCWTGYSALRKVRWYGYYPTAWVFQDLMSPNQVLAVNALNELYSRARAGRLDEPDTKRLAEFCLVEQAREPLQRSLGSRAIQILGYLHRQDRLTAEQHVSFIQHCWKFSANVRPTSIFGDPCPATLTCEPRCPFGMRATQIAVLQRIDESTDLRRVNGVQWNRADPIDLEAPFTGLTVGKPRIALIVELDMRDDQAGSGRVPIYHLRKEIELHTEVLASAPANYISQKTSPELDAAVRGCISRITVLDEKWGPGEPEYLRVWVKCGRAPPIGLAFELVAEFDGHTLEMQPVSLSPQVSNRGSRRSDIGMASVAELPGPGPATVTLVFRSSEKVAMQTADLREIWQGELRFEDLPVRVEQIQRTPETRER